MIDAKDGPLPWDEHKEKYAEDIGNVFKSYSTNIDDSNIVGRLAESPLGHHRHSTSKMYGDIFGIGLPGQIMGRRPTPSLSNYKTPGIDAVYLVGPFMHPGGLVTLGGRATAIQMYRDLGLDLSPHISPTFVARALQRRCGGAHGRKDAEGCSIYVCK